MKKSSQRWINRLPCVNSPVLLLYYSNIWHKVVSVMSSIVSAHWTSFINSSQSSLASQVGSPEASNYLDSVDALSKHERLLSVSQDAID